MNDSRNKATDDLAPIAKELSAARPSLSSERLAMTQERVRNRVRHAPNRRLGVPSWRPRVVITAILVLGIMMSTTGAGLAISGLGGDGSAAQLEGERAPAGAVSPETNSSPGQKGVAGTQQHSEPTVAGEQVAAQTEATAGKGGLPFTGLAAISLILVGVGMLAAGIGLRRRTPSA